MAKYCTRVHPVVEAINAPQPNTWRKLMQIKHRVEAHIIWKINDGGCNFFFWRDNWIGKGAFAKIFTNQSIYSKIKVSKSW